MSKWIDARDFKTPPPDGDEVLVCTECGAIVVYHFGKAVFSRGSKKLYDWEIYIDGEWSITMSVTHWMPLPEPPKN